MSNKLKTMQPNSHGRGVEQRVPGMRRMVEFNCTSTWLVWAERDHSTIRDLQASCSLSTKAELLVDKWNTDDI